MIEDRKAELLAVLAQVQADLSLLSSTSETEIHAVAGTFKSLAGEAAAILQQATTIVGCVEKEAISTVLPQVQTLCLAAKSSIEQRLDAASAIQGSLAKEQVMLQQLKVVGERQEAIARHLRALRVLTNIEVTHLGDAGGNFQLLAQELSTFSKSLSEQTQELAADSDQRSQAISATGAELSEKLPGLRNDVARMKADIENTLGVIDRGLSQQATIPIEFRRSAEETSRQIAGVIAAIQSHDITRQQIEHVQQALQLIASRVVAADDPDSVTIAAVYAGLKLQLCQLQNIKDSMSNWTGQMRQSMQDIEQLSASAVVDIGPTVLRQEQELSFRLAQVEQLQQKSGECCGGMQGTLRGLSSLAELVNQHLNRSQAIRDRLQILMLNSLIEAERLGHRGQVVSSIANLIREASADWNALADQSRLSLTQMLELVQQTGGLMEVFSETSMEKLREDQAQTRSALETVRSMAGFVAIEAGQMHVATERMQANLATVAEISDRLQISLRHLDSALRAISDLVGKLEKRDPGVSEGCDAAATEQWLSTFYTTETERQVMSAALYGTSLPIAQQSFAGNAVELF